jgi:hypothetical protein
MTDFLQQLQQLHPLIVGFGSIIALIALVTDVIKPLYNKCGESKKEVISFLSELDKSMVTLTHFGSPNEERKHLSVPLPRLFECCSVKSEECRHSGTGILLCESHLIRSCVLHHWPMFLKENLSGVVAVSISNPNELEQFRKKGLLPKKVCINLEPLIQKHHIHLDCRKNSLNDLLLSWKRAFLKYDRKLVGQFRWLQWQPNI